MVIINVLFYTELVTDLAGYCFAYVLMCDACLSSVNVRVYGKLLKFQPPNWGQKEEIPNLYFYYPTF